MWNKNCAKCGVHVDDAVDDDCEGSDIHDVNTGWDGHVFDWVGPLGGEGE